MRCSWELALACGLCALGVASKSSPNPHVLCSHELGRLWRESIPSQRCTLTSVHEATRLRPDSWRGSEFHIRFPHNGDVLLDGTTLAVDFRPPLGFGDDEFEFWSYMNGKRKSSPISFSLDPIRNKTSQAVAAHNLWQMGAHTGREGPDGRSRRLDERGGGRRPESVSDHVQFYAGPFDTSALGSVQFSMMVLRRALPLSNMWVHVGLRKVPLMTETLLQPDGLGLSGYVHLPYGVRLLCGWQDVCPPTA